MNKEEINYLHKESKKLLQELHDMKYKKEIEKLQERINKALEIVDNINKQYEEIKDKDLITNRVVDISVIQEIEKRLKGEDNEWYRIFIRYINIHSDICYWVCDSSFIYD